MQFQLNLDMWCCLSDKEFSLDELSIKLKTLFDKEGFTGILSLILHLTQEKLIVESLSNTNKYKWCKCDKPNYVLNGSYTRKIKSSSGEIKVNWRRLKCQNCNTTKVALRDFLKLTKYQRKTNELEKVVIDAVSKDSYRRAMNTLNDHGFVRVSHSTAHRWVVSSDCDEFDLSKKINEETPVQIIPDGTGFKGQPSDGKAEKGSLKVVIAVQPTGEITPIGAWTQESWDDIANKIPKTSKESILVSDGEPAITKSFHKIIDHQQRCQWHVVQDLYHAMWQDGGNSKLAKPLQNGLSDILAIELPKEDFALVSEEEKDKIEEEMEHAQSHINLLIQYLNINKFHTAAQYITNASEHLFSYVKRWLRTGIICPRASSLIERIMRELGRRIKKMGYNWSDKGCAKMARILLKKFTSPEEWEAFWNKKMNIANNVIFGIKQIIHHKV